jgi:eukaryotic-like serine/threonine-protein kinase
MTRANLLATMRRPKEAVPDYDQAVRIYTQLAADFPSLPGFRTRWARSHYNRAGVLLATGRLPLAQQDIDQALRINKQLAADFPSSTEVRFDLAANQNARGSLLLEMGRFKEAEQEFDQTLRIRKQLVAESPSQPELQTQLGSTFYNWALVYFRQGNFAAAKRLLMEGLPHRLAAVKARPGHPQDRLGYRGHLSLLPEVHAGLLEQEEAVHAAEAVRDLGYDPPADAYDAACFLSRCVRRVSKHDKLDVKERQQAAQFYNDRAMKLLRAAVSKGFKNVAHLKKDTDLDPLRQRDDFQKLVAELEAAAVPGKS